MASSTQTPPLNDCTIRTVKSILDNDCDLAWRQTSAIKRDCELVGQGDLFAQIEWQSSFKASAIATTDGNRWRFRLEGFVFRQWITIETADSNQAVGLFQAQPSFNGTLELPSGRMYTWESNFWLTKWLWSDAEGRELVRVDRNLSLKTEGAVAITGDGMDNPDLTLMITLGWYLIVLVTDLRPG